MFHLCIEMFDAISIVIVVIYYCYYYCSIITRIINLISFYICLICYSQSASKNQAAARVKAAKEARAHVLQEAHARAQEEIAYIASLYLD